MQNRYLNIDVEMPDSTMKRLQLSRHNCKKEFNEFVLLNKLSQEDSFALKNIVQAKLIQLFRSNHGSINSPALQKEKSNQESPRFREIQKQLEKSKSSLQVGAKNDIQNDAKILGKSDPPSFGISKQSAKILMTPSHSSSELKQLSQEIPCAPIAEEDQQQPIQQIIPIQYQFQEPKKFHVAEEENQSTQSFLHPKNETTTCKKDSGQFKKKIIQEKIIKKINFSPEKGHPCFSRLYKAQTDSFKNKKMQQIDHKQAKDYLQVEKYLLANKLKRVSPRVHQQLHKKSTESSKAKYTPQKTKQFVFQTPQTQKKQNPKKSTPKTQSGKLFKGSQWKSGSRCEKDILLAQQQKRKNNQKVKQKFIRQRMIQQKDTSPLKVHNEYKSRSCEKCSPKKTPQKKQKIPKQKLQSSQRINKPYISNLLLESYEQFYKGINPKKSQKPKIINQP